MGRTIGYELYSPDDLINPVQEIVYSYNALGQFSIVMSTNSQFSILNSQFLYSRLPGTDLISGYTASTPSTILTVSKTYEPNRNLVIGITNSVGSVPSVVSSFNYDNDTTGKRTARTDYYSGATVANTFNFNARGEVTNVTMNANAYNYNFDCIGNRTTSSVNSVFTAYTLRASGLRMVCWVP